MAENDIYDNKTKYERFVAQYNQFAEKKNSKDTSGAQYYHCKNKENLKIFPKLFQYFETNDPSYSRRMRLLNTLKLILYATDKSLANVAKTEDRTEINKIVSFARQRYSPRSMCYFVTDLKFLWKQLFPEKDQKGRVDETQMPYAVRHLKPIMDKSRQKIRKDLITFTEYKRILDSFNQDTRIQAFIALCFESLGRPQELLYLKIKHIQLYDNYGKATISEHGKEGIGLLRIIESYPYILKWYNQHPMKQDPNAYFFINLGKTNRYKQLKTHNINKMLRLKCKELGIASHVTCYSFKRNGVTHRRLRGDDDKQIQETARWTTTKQLHTYDLAGQEETFKTELMKKGLLAIDEDHEFLRKDVEQVRICMFCGYRNGFTEAACGKCTRLLNRDDILKQEEEKDKAMLLLNNRLAKMEVMFFKALAKMNKEEAIHHLDEDTAERLKSLVS